MILRQLKVGFMEVFCYLVGCEATKKAMVIDPAGDEDQIVAEAEQLGLTIEGIVNTHGHPDHTCGNAKVAQLTSAKIYMHTLDNAYFLSEEGKMMGQQMGFTPSPPADVTVEDGDTIPFGEQRFTVLHTPGHTPGGICLHIDKHLFTGDTLFVGAVGRTDFPGGSMQTLLQSIKEKILTLSDDTIIWPGHNYGVQPSSTVAMEKKHNPYITDL